MVNKVIVEDKDSVMVNKVIVEDNTECAFPNVEISLRIFLTYKQKYKCIKNCVFQQEPVLSIFQKKKQNYIPTFLISKVFD
jgi:hypothetical protein